MWCSTTTTAPPTTCGSSSEPPRSPGPPGPLVPPTPPRGRNPVTTDDTRTPRPGRRDLLKWSGALTAAAATGGFFTLAAAPAGAQPATPGLAAAAGTFAPIRPPAVPLAVRS